MSYLIYLRKSRADKEAEARGEGETLERHLAFLTELAEQRQLEVGAVYRELASGETIAARPRMQQLLLEVMQGLWEGVLVMEIERLARGDTKDQGTVAEAFKFSGTKIITPVKTYDPNNDFDEEYFEFSLFMSRREYKTINRRIQRGRIAAFHEGWYIAGTAPYGYRKVKHPGDKGYTLEIAGDEAWVVQLIFDLYTRGDLNGDGAFLRLGSRRICDYLNERTIPGRNGKEWSSSTILDILQNPVYTGWMRWQRRKVTRKIDGGLLVESRLKNNDCLMAEGRFPPIITPEQYELARKLRASRPSSSRHSDNALQNPLSGLLHCAKCGRLLIRALSGTRQNYPILRCPNSRCSNISAPLALIEERLLAGLDLWLGEYELPWVPADASHALSSPFAQHGQTMLRELGRQASVLERQISGVHDLLEQGVYTTDQFRERRNSLELRLKGIEDLIKKATAEAAPALNCGPPAADFFRELKKIPDVYRNLQDPYIKNQLLRRVLDHADYLKTERSRKGQAFLGNFELTIYPRLPKHPRLSGPYVYPHS